MTFDEAYNFLNTEQQQAVDTLDGPVLVVAGPGSGKTQLLALRVVNILRNRDVGPENILCLTFTEAGAQNMRDRLKRFIGTDAYDVGIYTFHGFGMSILQNFPEHILKYHNLTPVDDVRRDEMMEDILRSLRYDNPLRKTGVNGELLYRKPIVNMIGSLKKAGLSPQGFRDMLEQNQHDIELIQQQISWVFSINLKKKTALSSWEQALQDLLTLPSTPVHSYFDSLVDVYGNSLQKAIDEAHDIEKIKPVTNWKNTHLKANAQKEKELIDRHYIDKLLQVAEVYQAYQERLAQEGVFDYADMILQSLEALRHDPSLRDHLQEQYQYLLVDEFQDTNDAQMQLIYLLTQEKSAPNILAVGDDDQGIYKFQGAEISNIMSFQTHFPGTQIITLIKNYRSTQEILDVARQVIIQGQERLENVIEEVDKTLEAAGDHHSGEIKVYECASPEQEWTWVVDQVDELIQAGHDPEEIGVIGRSHKDLQDLSQYFLARDIPVNYRKSGNVLTSEYIHQLITMMEYVDSLTPDKKDRDDLLPEILSYPFWEIPRIDIWRFFQTHKRTKTSWIESLEASDHGQFSDIARIFRELALHSLSAPMERIVYSLLGEKQAGIPGLTTPFSDYYLSQEQMEMSSGRYMNIIADLRTFLRAIREYRKNTFIGLSEALAIIEHHRQSEGMYGLSQVSTGQQGVHLLTAHGSKGLEFETVFIIKSTQNVWAPKKKGDPLKLPSNMPLNPASENQDDFLRLYFVALTRAKRNLYITYPRQDNTGKAGEKLSFLTFLDSEAIDLDEERVMKATWQAETHDHFTSPEKDFLQGILQEYRLTPSHLNAFLDIDYSGPQHMLMQSILGLPQASSPQSAWGNALHHSFHYISRTLQSGYEFPGKVQVKQVALQSLQKEQLYREEVAELEQKLDDTLPDLLAHSKSGFYRKHWAEYSFRDLYVTFEEVPITGNIDRIEYDEDQKVITLVDFKTGKAIESWSDYQEKSKLTKFKRQLDFYGVLMAQAGFWTSGWSLRGRIDFLEPNPEGEYISLEREITQQDIDFIRTLITCIYGYISRLDFPEITKYHKQGGVKAQEQFLQDLLDKSV